MKCNIPPLRPGQKRAFSVPVTFLNDTAILAADNFDVKVAIEGPCQGETQRMSFSNSLQLQFNYAILGTYEAPPAKQRQVDSQSMSVFKLGSVCLLSTGSSLT